MSTGISDTKTSRLARLSGRMFLVLMGMALLCGLAAYLQSSALLKWLSGMAANATFSEIYGLWQMVLVIGLAEFVFAGILAWVVFRFVDTGYHALTDERVRFFDFNSSPYHKLWQVLKSRYPEETASVSRTNHFIMYWMFVAFIGYFAAFFFGVQIIRLHLSGIAPSLANALYLNYFLLALAQFIVLFSTVLGWRMVSKFSDILQAINQHGA